MGFFTSMGSLMLFQITKQCKFLLTCGAAEWFFTNMNSFMLF